ncbi:MAG: hypothetical protein WBD40_21000 [Tepidisphaeraceae bacterium]
MLAVGSTAQAALILHVEDKTLTASATTVTLDIWLEETGATNFNVASYNVGLRLSPTGTLTFASHAVSTGAHPTLFTDDAVITNQTPNASPPFGNYNAANDRLLADDLLVDGTDVAVQNDDREGLFSVTLNISANALGVFALNVDLDRSEIADSQANVHTLVIDNGLITINPVPEPAFMGLALLGLPLLCRRRK